MAATHALRRCPDAFSVARCTPKHGRALHKHLCTATVVAPRAASTASLRRVVVQAKRDPEVQVDQAVKGGLVNPAFAAVLSEALSRGGADELGGAESSVEAERAAPIEAVEGVLEAAVLTSRQKLQRLVQQQSQLEAEIGTESKQLERLQYLLGKVRNDYAYFAAVERMNDRQSAVNQQQQRQQGQQE